MKNKQILVVDDLSDWRKTLVGVLEDAGFDVVSADSIEAALEISKRINFDLALLDIRLDETDEENVDGLNLAYEIKKINPDVKIIVVSGYATVDLVRRALKPTKTGSSLVTNFISKTETDDLLRTISKLLSE